mgnify:CR=1 FL=1
MLSPFQKEHKANLKKMSKDQLINQILITIDNKIQSDLENEQTISILKKQNINLEWYLKSSESALAYKDKVIERYQKLLSFSVEDI